MPMKITHDISDFAKLIHIRVWRHYEFILWASDFKHILLVCQPKHEIYHFSSLRKIRLIHSCWYHNTLAPHIHPWIQSIFYTSLWWWIFGVNKLFFEKLCSFAVNDQSTVDLHRFCVLFEKCTVKRAWHSAIRAVVQPLPWPLLLLNRGTLFSSPRAGVWRTDFFMIFIVINFWKNIVEAGSNWSIG